MRTRAASTCARPLKDNVTMAQLWPGLGGPSINYISDTPGESWQQTWPRSLVLLGSTGSIGRSTLEVAAAHPKAFRMVGFGPAPATCSALRNRPSRGGRRIWLCLTKNPQPNYAHGCPRTTAPAFLWGAMAMQSWPPCPRPPPCFPHRWARRALPGRLRRPWQARSSALPTRNHWCWLATLCAACAPVQGAVVLPVDSEHNAIFQCLAGRGQEVERLILTASGGPFRGWTREALSAVTPEQALKHPNWSMGAKITIDSATLYEQGAGGH